MTLLATPLPRTEPRLDALMDDVEATYAWFDEHFPGWERSTAATRFASESEVEAADIARLRTELDAAEYAQSTGAPFTWALALTSRTPAA